MSKRTCVTVLAVLVGAFAQGVGRVEALEPILPSTCSKVTPVLYYSNILHPELH